MPQPPLRSIRRRLFALLTALALVTVSCGAEELPETAAPTSIVESASAEEAAGPEAFESDEEEGPEPTVGEATASAEVFDETDFDAWLADNNDTFVIDSDATLAIGNDEVRKVEILLDPSDERAFRVDCEAAAEEPCPSLGGTLSFYIERIGGVGRVWLIPPSPDDEPLMIATPAALPKLEAVAGPPPVIPPGAS